jgi:hypothetical protein
MRIIADRARIEQFMKEFGPHSQFDARVYFTGGATAVLQGWRATTADVDIHMAPEDDALFRAIPEIKERLRINVELASPLQFIPVPDNWEARSQYIQQDGRTSFYHFDFYAQALSKIERNHEQDREDVAAMLRLGLVSKADLWAYFEAIEPRLYRFPAIDAKSFVEKVRSYLR